MTDPQEFGVLVFRMMGELRIQEQNNLGACAYSSKTIIFTQPDGERAEATITVMSGMK